MTPRGGERKGAGRPSRGLETTKITVYKETRDILNEYSQKLNIPVAEIIFRIVHYNKFDGILERLIKIPESKKWFEDL